MWILCGDLVGLALEDWAGRMGVKSNDSSGDGFNCVGACSPAREISREASIDAQNKGKLLSSSGCIYMWSVSVPN